MDKNQIAVYESHLSSDDFLDDNAVVVNVRTQITPLALRLKGKIADVGVAMAKAERDNRGYSIDKQEKLTVLRHIMLKVGRAGTALYRSTNNLGKLSATDFTKGELDNLQDARVLTYAQELYSETLPDAANLIGADAADLTALQAAITAVADVFEGPRRAIDNSKRYNDSIVDLLNDCNKTRNEIDIYMQTFIDENLGLYTEWKLSMAIHDAPTHSNPDLTVPISCGGTGIVTTIEYTPINGALTGSTNIKFTLPTPLGQGVSAGFGPDPATIIPGTELQLSAGANPRVTAASLGYDINAARFLNIRNATPSAVSVSVEFYLAD